MKENLFNILVITNGDMSGNLTSSIVDVSKINATVFYAKWTGTPTGSIKLQVSIDDVNWVDLPSSSQATGGAAGDFMWNVTDTNYDKIKLVYTFSSGSGTLNVQANGKGSKV